MLDDKEWNFGFPREIVDENCTLSDVDRNYAHKAANAMVQFTWSDTDEGFYYWLDVRKRLMRIVRDGR